MSWGRPLKFVKNSADNSTHFLCIPLLAPAVRPRFRASIASLLNHPAWARVPTEAIRPPGTLHISLGGFNLLRPDDATAATKLLESIDIANVLEISAACSKNGIKFDPKRYVAEHSQQRHSTLKKTSSLLETGPVKVCLRGLWCKQGKEAASSRLGIGVVDPTYRLQPVAETIRHAFHFAGFAFSSEILLHRDKTNRTMEEFLSTPIIQAVIMQMMRSGNIVSSFQHPGKFRQETPEVDLRDVLTEYQNHTWLENLRLEKVSLCRLGMAKEILRRGGGIDSDMELFEDFSIPLP
jgi:activating signal cointegrator complex subunit 1